MANKPCISTLTSCLTSPSKWTFFLCLICANSILLNAFALWFSGRQKSLLQVHSKVGYHCSFGTSSCSLVGPSLTSSILSQTNILCYIIMFCLFHRTYYLKYLFISCFYFYLSLHSTPHYQVSPIWVKASFILFTAQSPMPRTMPDDD